MIGVPVNSNSIHVSIVQTGCCKGEFDSTYPVHLNGIISQEEFRESIEKINRTISSSVGIIFVTIIFILGLTAGTTCSIIGGRIAANLETSNYLTFIYVGIALSTFGSMFFVFGLLIIHYRRTARMRLVIAEESMKYSSRSPTPCSWRLEAARQFYGGYGYNNAKLVYHLVIDIGRSTAPENGAYYSNQPAPQSSSVFVGQTNNYAPPPYSGQSTGFCSHCGAVRQDNVAKFCSSCGQAYNRY